MNNLNEVTEVVVEETKEIGTKTVILVGAGLMAAGAAVAEGVRWGIKKLRNWRENHLKDEFKAQEEVVEVVEE